MAYVPSGLQNLSNFQSFEDSKGYLAGEAPLVSSPGGSYGGGSDPAGGGVAPTNAAPQQQTLSTQQSGVSPDYAGSLFDTSQTQTSAGVFDPLQKGLTATSQELEQFGQDFQKTLPALRTWDGIGAKGTLDAAIQPGGAMEPAKGLVGASYSGPTGLDQSQLGQFYNQQKQLSNQAGALTSGSGLENILSLGAPGITPGEARFEAGRTISQPGYQAQARQLENQANAITQALQQTQETAQGEVGKRQRGEAQIASKSRGYLEGSREKLLAQLDKEIGGIKNTNAETLGQWGQIMEGGDASLLPEGLRSQFTNTDTQRERAAAEAAWQRVMSQYPDLAGMDPLNLKISGRGHERYTAPGGEIGGDYYRGDPGTWNQLQERQQALEGLFSPGTRASFQGYQPYGETGKYSDVAPMYDYQNAVGSEVPKQPWETPDVRNYLSLDEGLDPNRSDVSTDDQKEVFNRINTLLGEAERLGESQPWRAAQILGDVDAFITEEERRAGLAAGESSQAATDWSNMVGKSRRRYKKAERSSDLSNFITLGGGVGGLAVGGVPGAAIGAGLGSGVSPEDPLNIRSAFGLIG